MSCPDREGIKQYVVVDRVATLAWLAQEAAVELHPWTATVEAPDRPRYALIDIDPGGAPRPGKRSSSWRACSAQLWGTSASSACRRRRASAALQVWIPIADGYTFDQTRDWVEQLSRAIGQTVPDLVSWAWSKRDRRGRARLDYTQNAPIRTLVAPYSVRPAAGAPVSVPIELGRARGSDAGARRLDRAHPAPAVG